MDSTVKHILSENDILFNFSICRKYSKKKLNELKEQALNKSKENNSVDGDKILNDLITQDTFEYMRKNKIPGIINEFNEKEREIVENKPKQKKTNNNNDIKKIGITNLNQMQLYKLALNSLIELKKLNISEKDSVFFALCLINMLNLSNEEFSRYTKEILSESSSSEGEELDEDGDEDD